MYPIEIQVGDQFEIKRNAERTLITVRHALGYLRGPNDESFDFEELNGISAANCVFVINKNPPQ